VKHCEGEPRGDSTRITGFVAVGNPTTNNIITKTRAHTATTDSTGWLAQWAFWKIEEMSGFGEMEHETRP